MYREQLTHDELDLLLQPNTATAADSIPTTAETHDKQADAAILRLHTAFAPNIVNVCSSMAGRPVTARLKDASRGTFGQFVLGQPIPTCCAIVNADPLDTDLVITIRPSILFPLVDRWLGCDVPEAIPQRPLSEIETKLAERFLNQLLEQYCNAWQRVLALQLRIERIEHNAHQIDTFTGGEESYLVRYDLALAPYHGRLELCLPWQATQQMRERLAAS